MRKLGGSRLAVRRVQHRILFICRALLGKLPKSLSIESYLHCNRHQNYLVLEILNVHSEIGKLAFKYYAPHKWNNLQKYENLESPFYKILDPFKWFGAVRMYVFSLTVVCFVVLHRPMYHLCISNICIVLYLCIACVFYSG